MSLVGALRIKFWMNSPNLPWKKLCYQPKRAFLIRNAKFVFQNHWEVETYKSVLTLLTNPVFPKAISLIILSLLTRTDWMGTKSCDRVGYKRVKKRSPRHSVQHKFYTSHIKWKSSSTFRLHSGVASESASRPVEVSIHRPPVDSSSSIAILLLSVLMVYINSGSRTDIPTVSRNARAARFRFWPCP